MVGIATLLLVTQVASAWQLGGHAANVRPHRRRLREKGWKERQLDLIVGGGSWSPMTPKISNVDPV